MSSREDHSTIKGNYKTDLTLTGLLMEGLGLQSCLLCYDFATGMLGRVEANMQDEEWIKTLEDGRIVKFIYQELLEDGAFISAQLAGNEVV
jgi:hypothetical protein